MTTCPECHAEYDHGGTICPNCGYEIEAESDDEGSRGRHYPWVLVYTTGTEYEAAMFKANLEGAGIPTQILSQRDSTRNFTIGDLAVVKIFVLSPYATEAKEIISEIEKNKF